MCILPNYGHPANRCSMINRLLAAAVALLFATLQPALGQRGPVRVDLTNAAAVAAWQPTHDVSRIEATPEGMRIQISGGDPYIHGPAYKTTPGTPLWLRLRVKSDRPGTLQVFYFRHETTEAQSARVAVLARKWEELALPLPPLEEGTRLRIDPPGVDGSCTIAWLELAERRLLPVPKWTPPPPAPSSNVKTVRSGALVLRHSTTSGAAYGLTVGGSLMAAGWSRLPTAYEAEGKMRWFDLARIGRTKVTTQGAALHVAVRGVDPDGGLWTYSQTFRPAARDGGIDVVSQLSCSRRRTVFFFPMLAIFPGHGSYGHKRERALFAGVEYLDPPDTSSSEADLIGEQSKRLAPDQAKLTLPLMVVQANRRYIGIIWRKEPWLAAAFDSPDRSFGSHANAQALIIPGSDGLNRSEGSLFPYTGYPMKSGVRLIAHATIIGGSGASVLPAVQRCVQQIGLPPVPETGLTRTQYARWAAHGWLDSKIRDGARFRHAYWPGVASFPPTVAADAALWMEWLARTCSDRALSDRLNAEVEDVLNLTDPASRNQASVSHVTYPATALLFGDVAKSMLRSRQSAAQALKRFARDGTVPYQASSTDYGRTHYERHANGLTAPIVAGILMDAVYAGDGDLIKAGIERLRGLDRYTNSAPRGAQTWEVPLHTPDILASAWLVKAYLLGYEITGEKAFLNKAIHWAWTGVPFVYLVRPTAGPIGLYATIPVLGATGWVAPNWIGLPVQWCGLVYSDALYRLAGYDPKGPWKRLADGITASGIQQSWPAGDRDLQALLPDSVTLKSQTRNPVAINPGTVQANAIQLLGGPEVFDYRILRDPKITILAPAKLTELSPGNGLAAYKVEGWPDRPYHVLIHGVPSVDRIRVNDQRPSEAEIGPGAAHIILRLRGDARIAILR